MEEEIPRLPNNNFEQVDGGFLFTAWGIHVATESLEIAKAIVLRDHGKDVDNDIPPIIQSEDTEQPL